MTDDDEDDDVEGNLLERAEWYFCQIVASSKEYAALVLRTCLRLLSDAAETAAFLAGRCVEALAVSDQGGKCVWLDDLAACTAEEFQMIVDAIRDCFSDGHDLLYRIVDHYLENWNGKLTEEEKNQICCAMDCKKLSRNHLIHLVRNPRMPLRFVVQAMLTEQFHTRVSFLDGVCKTRVTTPAAATTTSSITLGAILQRDAAFRQAAHLKAVMEATSFRIQSLERELSGMKRRLKEKREEEKMGEKKAVETRLRSESFRFFGEEEEEEVETRLRSESFRFFREEERVMRSKDRRGLGRKLIQGFRSVFRSAVRSGSESRSTSCSGAEDVVPTEELRRRCRSFA